MTEFAKKVLEGVVRYRPKPPGVMVPDQTGVWVDHRQVAAAIAKMGTGDGLVERLNRADEYEPLGHDGWEAAAHIAALRAVLDEARVYVQNAADGDHMHPQIAAGVLLQIDGLIHGK
jgi:hypothetical protein